MPESTITITLNEELTAFITGNTVVSGAPIPPEEYIINLIEQEIQLNDDAIFNQLQSKLKLAFSEPDSSYYEFTIDNILNGTTYGYL